MAGNLTIRLTGCSPAARARADYLERYAPLIQRMPPKIRELVADLEAAGFTDRGGKGSHRNFVHPKVSRPITVSGQSGSDAKQYQVRADKLAIQESRK